MADGSAGGASRVVLATGGGATATVTAAGGDGGRFNWDPVQYVSSTAGGASGGCEQRAPHHHARIAGGRAHP